MKGSPVRIRASASKGPGQRRFCDRPSPGPGAGGVRGPPLRVHGAYRATGAGPICPAGTGRGNRRLSTATTSRPLKVCTRRCAFARRRQAPRVRPGWLLAQACTRIAHHRFGHYVRFGPDEPSIESRRAKSQTPRLAVNHRLRGSHLALSVTVPKGEHRPVTFSYDAYQGRKRIAFAQCHATPRRRTDHLHARQERAARAAPDHPRHCLWHHGLQRQRAPTHARPTEAPEGAAEGRRPGRSNA